MITRTFPSMMIALTLGLTIFPSAQAAPSKVNLIARTIKVPDAKPEGKPDNKPGKPKPGAAEVENRKLEATLKNLSVEAMSGVQVRFFYLGHEASSTDIKVLDKDTQTKEIAAGAQVVVESKAMSAKYSPAYTPKPAKGAKSRPDRVKASGEKFTGWAVQVVSADALVAEAYSSPTMKDALGAEGAVAAKP